MKLGVRVRRGTSRGDTGQDRSGVGKQRAIKAGRQERHVASKAHEAGRVALAQCEDIDADTAQVAHRRDHLRSNVAKAC